MARHGGRANERAEDTGGVCTHPPPAAGTARSPRHQPSPGPQRRGARASICRSSPAPHGSPRCSAGGGSPPAPRRQPPAAPSVPPPPRSRQRPAAGRERRARGRYARAERSGHAGPRRGWAACDVGPGSPMPSIGRMALGPMASGLPPRPSEAPSPKPSHRARRASGTLPCAPARQAGLRSDSFSVK